MNPSTLQRLLDLRADNEAAARRQAAQAPRFAAYANRAAPVAVSAFQLFQTPPAIAARLVALLRLTGPGARILEPSAGLGRILDALPEGLDLHAVEISPDCSRVLAPRRLKLHTRDFLTTTPEELGTFDAVAMNPPFHMRADIRHIRHALRFLRPRGRLAAICMDTPQRLEALRPQAEEWHPLPPGTFKDEGTQTATVLLSIRSPTP